MKSFFNLFNKKSIVERVSVRVDPIQIKRNIILKEITTAEEERRFGDNLLSLQHYLKLLSVDPLYTIENVAWFWVNGAWYLKAPTFHYPNWIIIKSNSEEMVELFQKASKFPRQIISSDTEETTKYIIEELIKYIGLPGVQPNEQILEITNKKIDKKTNQVFQ